MVRGDGCLFWATGTGTAAAGVSARPVQRVTPTMWHEHCVAAWTASWVKLCGYELLGQREVLQRPEWAAEISWRDHRGSYRTTIRPEMVALFEDGDRVAIQFELTRTSRERRRASLVQHAAWQAAGQSAQLLYVCGDESSRERIRSEAAAVGLSAEDGTLGVELVDTIRKSALVLFRERRA